ncbi:uncharacterized protein TNCV_4298691 [Trichonephila clavipes]|nr:uncharacterized protein TNCV_4298691 [Trichonephila clavipes]
MTNRDSSYQDLSPTDPWAGRDSPGPSAGAFGDVSKGTRVGRLMRSPIPNSVLRYYSIWPCIVLGCLLSHCLAPVLLHRARQSPTTFFFDSVWTSNTLSYTAGFNVIHPLCISTNNCRSRTTHESCSFGNTYSEPSSHYNLPSIKVT